MLRLSRRAWATIGAGTALAISASIACGETLPAIGVEDPNDAGRETGGSDGTDAGTDDDAGDGASDATDGSIEAGAPCTPDLPYDGPEPLDNFDGLGAVSSVRPHHGGAPFAFVARDLGSGGFFDIVETEYPMPPSGNPSALRSETTDEDHPAPLAGNMKVYYDEPIDGGVLRIFSATRTQAGQKLDNPVLEEIPLGGGTSVMHPWSVAGQDILYVALRNGTTTVNIWRLTKSAGVWAAEQQLMGPFEKTHPVVSDDQTVIYFARNETGERKIFYATRASSTDGWSTALEVDGDINRPGADDEPSWLSPDKCTLIFTSNRLGSTRAYKIVRKHL